MTSKTIIWNKKYHEDVGTKDSEGFYDYAYQYYIYWFSLPEGGKLKIRSYTDNPTKFDLFGIYDNLGAISNQIDDRFVYSEKCIAAIIQFIKEKEDVKTFTYFNEEYLPLDLNKISTPLNYYQFNETKE